MKTFFKKCFRDLSGFLDRIFSESTVSVMKLLSLIAFVVALWILCPRILMWTFIAVGIVIVLFDVACVVGPKDSPLFFVLMVPVGIAAVIILAILEFISNMVILALSNKNAITLDDLESDPSYYS